MFYTTAPISLMGTVWPILVIALIFGVVFLSLIWVNYASWRKIWGTIFLVTTFLWVYAAWDNYKLHKELVNEKVIVTKVRNSATIEARATGRHTSGLFSVLYVEYMTPDGIISIRAIPGVTYPDKAYMYRNPMKYSF